MAAPVKQPIPINFSGGLDLKTDPWQVGPANFLALNNMVFSKGGRLSKRNGFASLGTSVATPSPSFTYSNVGATISSARKIMAYKDELLVNDAFNLYSYDEAANNWIYKGRSTMVGVATDSIANAVTGYVDPDSSIDNTTGIKVFAYTNAAGEVQFSIQDVETGQLIVNQAYFDAKGVGYTLPRCVSIAGKSWITALKTSDSKIYFQAIVGQTVTGSVTALITNMNAAKPFYDVDVDVNTGNIYIAWHTSTPSISIAAISSSFVVGNTITKVESATHGVSWFGDGTNIWVCYNNGTATKAFIVNNAVSATILAPTTVDSSALAANVNNVTGCYSSTQSKAFIFYDPITKTSTITATAAINYNTLTVAGTAGTATLLMGSLSINSKAFVISGIPHILGIYTYPTANGTAIQPTNFLINIYNVTPTMGNTNFSDVIGNIAAKISADEAAGVAPTLGKLCGVHQASSGVWLLASLQSSNFTIGTEEAPSYSPNSVMAYQFDFSLTNPDAQDLGNNEIIASGQVGMYDGGIACEQNFHIYPNASSFTVGGGGGITTAVNSIYSYIYVYEWVDNEGQIHRSFPSPVVTPLAAGQAYTFAAGTTNGQVSLTIPTLRVTNKPGSQVVISIYRTLANGSVYYRLNATYGALLNDPSVNSVAFNDVLPDGTIVGNVQLYTNGALGYYAPPGTRALTNFKNRLLSVPFEGGSEFGYSNQVLQNFPVQFVPFFIQNVGTIGGPLVTAAGMDDKIILFRSGTISGPSIMYMVGKGPTPSGANNDFTDPLPVAVDVGCTDRASVVMTPVGLMFKSNKGIYLLDRNLQASYIGAPVEAYNQYSVVSAQLIPNTTEVRFLLSNGTLLMYDYFYKVWGTFTNPAGVSDCIFQGQHTYISSTGVVYKETPNLYVDGTVTPILMSFTTSWIKLAGLQGYQRAFFFYLLAEYISAHTLSISTYTNFSLTPDDTFTITPDSTSDLENWRVFFSKQRCQSFQISLAEVAGSPNGAAFTLSGLNLIAGMKSPFRTISAAQSVG